MTAFTKDAPEPMPGPAVTVYTLPTCPQCDATTRHLDRLGVPFRYVSLLDVPEVAEGFKAEGFMAAPIVVTPLGTWSGYRPDRVKALAD